MTADLRNCRHLIEDYLKMNLCGVNSAGIKLSLSYVIHMDSKLSKTSSLNAKGGKTLGFSTILFSIFKNTKKTSGTTILKKNQVFNNCFVLFCFLYGHGHNFNPSFYKPGHWVVTHKPWLLLRLSTRPTITDPYICFSPVPDQPPRI